jgi:hypothetical protein
LFPAPKPSAWVLKEKLSENAYLRSEEECKETEMISEARAVFICSRVDSIDSEEAIIKIRMQLV